MTKLFDRYFRMYLSIFPNLLSAFSRFRCQPFSRAWISPKERGSASPGDLLCYFEAPWKIGVGICAQHVDILRQMNCWHVREKCSEGLQHAVTMFEKGWLTCSSALLCFFHTRFLGKAAFATFHGRETLAIFFLVLHEFLECPQERGHRTVAASPRCWPQP